MFVKSDTKCEIKGKKKRTQDTKGKDILLKKQMITAQFILRVNK